MKEFFSQKSLNLEEIKLLKLLTQVLLVCNLIHMPIPRGFHYIYTCLFVREAIQKYEGFGPGIVIVIECIYTCIHSAYILYGSLSFLTFTFLTPSF